VVEVAVMSEDAAAVLPSNQSRAHNIIQRDRGRRTDIEAVLRTNGKKALTLH
jgi:hypothetical protein